MPLSPLWVGLPSNAGFGTATLSYMCGIVAVVAAPSLRPSPDPGEVASTFALALEELTPLGGRPTSAPGGPADKSTAEATDGGAELSALSAATALLSALDASLRGVPGLTCLLRHRSAVEALERGTTQMEALAAGLEAALDAGYFKVGTARLEELNAGLVKFRDVIWALGRDRLQAARSVSALAERPRAWARDRSRAGRSGGSFAWRPRRPLGRPRRLPVPRPSRSPRPGLSWLAPHALGPRPRPGV